MVTPSAASRNRHIRALRSTWNEMYATLGHNRCRRSRGDGDRNACLRRCSVAPSPASIVREGGEGSGNSDDQRPRTRCWLHSRHRPQHSVRSDRQFEGSFAGPVDPPRGVLPQRHDERNRCPRAAKARLHAHCRTPRRHERLEADRPYARALETGVTTESRRLRPPLCRPADRSPGESDTPPAH